MTSIEKSELKIIYILISVASRGLDWNLRLDEVVNEITQRLSAIEECHPECIIKIETIYDTHIQITINLPYCNDQIFIFDHTLQGLDTQPVVI